MTYNVRKLDLQSISTHWFLFGLFLMFPSGLSQGEANNINNRMAQAWIVTQFGVSSNGSGRDQIGQKSKEVSKENRSSDRKDGILSGIET